MTENSKIEWTDHTANFWWGCFKVSPGCKNCYADTLSKRWGKSAIWGPPEHSPRELKKGIWKELPKWNQKAKESGQRRKVFVMSMGDFFEDHPQVNQWRKDALDLIGQSRWLDFQVLTKRPENVNEMIVDYAGDIAWLEDSHNVWIGTSVENQEQYNLRVPKLLKIPASELFLSCEPLLEPVDLQLPSAEWYAERKISWVIVGGESGRGKRPFNPDWARSIRDQCQATGVPFFMKQMDKVQPIPSDLMIREFPHQEAVTI